MSTRENDSYTEWLNNLSGVDLEELHAVAHNSGELTARFCRELEFGTGGLRGILGVGTNRMNVPVVRRATRGLVAYLKEECLPLSVAIAYDSRKHSRLFAETAASVLTASGVDAWIYPRLQPTPALSWAVRKLGCGGGIMITASHNPAEYNGYKVYGPDGCQITDDAAAKILDHIHQYGYFDEFAHSEEGVKREIPESVLDEFLERELAGLFTRPEGLRVIYTPLNGAGLECVKRALTAAGVGTLTVVPEQEQPDGNFPTCPEPNPEKQEAMELGLKLCAIEQPDLLLATDPDCDRVGVAVPDGDGYRLLNGNEMGVLLLDYLCKVRVEQGAMPERPVAVTTIVSTQLAAVVAANYGVELRRTLTGFKYIGEQIGLLEQTGGAERFLFGFEESYGYLSASHVRDKDAVNASLMVCGMAAYYKEKGQGLLDVLNSLICQFGAYSEGSSSFDFKGTNGLDHMCTVMERLRASTPVKLAGAKVLIVEDYCRSEKTGLPRSDVLAFRLENDDSIIIRPSGTEPKMKAYLSAHKATTQESIERLAELKTAAAVLICPSEEEESSLARRKKDILQFIKFCVVGASNSVVSLAVYYLVVFLNNEAYLAANVVSWLVSVLNSFYWNNKMVFAGGKRDWKSIGGRLFKTYAAYGATMLLSTGLLHFEVELWRISRFIAPIINICITTPINFIMNKFWAFAKKS